jgi:hypothetical protein
VGGSGVVESDIHVLRGGSRVDLGDLPAPRAGIAAPPQENHQQTPTETKQGRVSFHCLSLAEPLDKWERTPVSDKSRIQNM